MPKMRKHPGAGRAGILLLLALPAVATTARAQTLPFRRYDIQDGLANSRVNSVFQDSRGYLWFATWEGLSRFDGVEFRNYSTAEGLPTFLVNVVAEDPRGRIWVATQGGGIARLLDRDERTEARTADGRRSMFEVHRIGPEREANIVAGIVFDRSGGVWCGCESGIYRASPESAPQLAFERIVDNAAVDSKQFGCVDARGRIWLSTKGGILELEGSNVVARHAPPESSAGLAPPMILLPAPEGGILVVYPRDVFVLARVDDPAASPGWRRLPIAFAPFQEARCATFGSKRTLWIGTTAGLVRWRDEVQSTFGSENGLPDVSVRSLLEDRDGDLWMATWSSGVAKLGGEAFLNFLDPSTMPDRNSHGMIEAIDGSIYATGANGIVRIDDGRLDVVPGSTDSKYRTIGARIAQDRRGDFWIGTADGVYLFPGPVLDMRGGRHLGERDGADHPNVFGTIYEDPQSRIWFGDVGGYLYGWDPAKSPSPLFERTEVRSEGLPQGPRALLRDSADQLWLGPYVGVSRLIAGRLEPLQPCEGLPDLQTRCFFQDHRGRLWIGTRFRGASVTDEPAAARPRFRNYSTSTGLASDAVWSIVEDGDGRIYLGTSRGIERIDVDSGAVRHLTTFDGLAGDIVNSLLRDRHGNIWAATSGGISRFDPRAEPPPPASPPVYISRIRVAGEDLPISETGEIAAPEVSLPASRDNLLIEFVGLCFRDERALAYEYRLDGVDAEWCQASAVRSVNYAHLAPGSYRFQVRAVHVSGARSAVPASFAFEIAHPTWQQPWFVALVALAAGGIAYALHRSRVRRILALEGIRTQIATDIHDDMGSGLSQIAILAEVAKREPGGPAQVHLEEVARLARALRDSMSDIVWAVDPRRDRFGDLVQRMRQAAFNLLESEGMRVEFRAPTDAALEDLDLAPDRRRHLLLVLKESLSNVARHARASSVEVEIRFSGGVLYLSIRDDGCGFDPEAPTSGHGLSSLRRRAEKLGGTIRIESSVGGGTKIDLEVPA